MDCMTSAIARECANDTEAYEQSQLAVTMEQFGIVLEHVCRDNVDGIILKVHFCG